MVEKRFHLAMKGLVVSDNTFLILKKSDRPGKEYGIWELPGGGLDFGEMPEEALKREIKEEIGIEVDVKKPILVWGFMKTPDIQVVGITYMCKAMSKDIKLSHEHDDFKWIRKDEIDTVNLFKELREDMEKWSWNDIFE